MVPDPALVARFATDLDRLIGPQERLGLAVSGGPDSLALLLLAAAARPGAVEAATVDHALRPESAAEADRVAGICRELGVPHAVLVAEWDTPPTAALQESARDKRYALLAGWMRQRGLAAVATGHHRDDQAETLLMRLARGAGVRGLAGMRPAAPVPGDAGLRLLRPLLAWRHDELSALCAAAGITPVADPSNADERFERVRVRRSLAATQLDAEALSLSARHLAQADEALDWAMDRAWDGAVAADGPAFTLAPEGLPDEIRRRMVRRLVGRLSTEGPGVLRGRELDRLLHGLAAGRAVTLRGVKCSGGRRWRFEPAPPRR